MALILVNAGQCGNQLGFDCLDSLYDNTARDSADQAMFFRESKAAGGKPVARAVCLDTEPKAVLSCLQRSARKDWAFDPAACAYRHGGAGNNWAMGYQMCSGKFLDASLDCIRRELEHCDLPPTLLTSHSLGGGTGSGLGTKITEAVAEVFPDVTRINATVMPYHFGEVIVQHYNSVLCLSKIAQCSDGIMLFDNEIAHDMCKTGFGKDRPVLKDLNLAISMGLVSALLPKTSTCTGAADGSVQSSGLPMQIAHLCSHPGFKFLDVKFVPQTSERSVEYTYDTWKALMGRLQVMQRAGTTSEAQASSAVSGLPGGDCRTLGAVITLRGRDAQTAAASLSTGRWTEEFDIWTPRSRSGMSEQMAPSSANSIASGRDVSRSRYMSGTRSSVARDATAFDKKSSNTDIAFIISAARCNECNTDPPMLTYHSEHCVSGYQRSASIMSNGQSVLPYLQRPALKAAKMFSSGAYVHQYTTLGIERDEFVDAFLNIGQIIQNYQSL